MEFRVATPDDALLLARLNQALIRDERHRNALSLEELQVRMAGWLASEYRAVLFELDGQTIGYALFREEADHIYLRQFFVLADARRKGVGRAAIEWLRANAWGVDRRIRLDVLVGNSAAIAFWRAVGFRDYCLTLELEGSDDPE